MGGGATSNFLDTRKRAPSSVLSVIASSRLLPLKRKEQEVQGLYLAL
jgi:hypothetical protein